MKAKVKSFYHQDTFTWSHLVVCQNTKCALLIDPVLDYSPSTAHTSTVFIDSIIAYIKSHDINLKYILETHAHADHLTASAFVQQQFNAKTLIGVGIIEVQKTFKNIYNLDDAFKTDGQQFNALLIDKQVIQFGDCQMIAMHTPGHTNDSMSYIVADNIFIGDTLFAPDYGSARCDFPGGKAQTLYDSVHKIFALGSHKKLYLCHDYPQGNREPQAWFLSSEQQQNNIHINLSISQSEFIKTREERDKQLSAPELIIPSIQINIAAGNFPKPENNHIAYLKVPLNTFGT